MYNGYKSARPGLRRTKRSSYITSISSTDALTPERGHYAVMLRLKYQPIFILNKIILAIGIPAATRAL